MLTDITGRDLSQSVQPAAWLGQSDLLTPKPSESHLFPTPNPPILENCDLSVPSSWPVLGPEAGLELSCPPP